MKEQTLQAIVRALASMDAMDEYAGVDVLEQAMHADPHCHRVRVWFAYFLLSFFGNEFEYIASTLQEVIGEASEDGSAACYLMAYAHYKYSREEETQKRLLERSIGLSPGWVSNHFYYGILMRARGSKIIAVTHLREARSNHRAIDPSWDVERAAFESNITWRTSDGVQILIRDELREMKED